MDSDFLKFLFDLDHGLRRTDLSDPQSWWIVWERLWESWIVVAAIAGAAAFAIWAYAGRGRGWAAGAFLTLLLTPILLLTAGAAAAGLIWVWWRTSAWEVAGVRVGAVLPYTVPALAAGGFLAAYRVVRDGPLMHAVPAALRLAALLVVLTMLLGPALTEIGEPSRGVVLVLIDDSGSMGTVDAAPVQPAASLDAGSGNAASGDAPAKAASRLQLVKAALAEGEGRVLRELLDNNRLRVMAFSTGIDQTVAADGPDDLPAALAMIAGLRPDGADSHVNAAVIESLKRAAGQLPAAVVVISDGRRTGGPAAGPAVARARTGHAMPVPVWTVVVGDPAPRKDLVLHQVLAEGDAYAKDQVEVQALVSAPGFPPGTRLDVRLTQKDGPRTLQFAGGSLPKIEPVVWKGGDAPVPVKLYFTAPAPGRYNLTVRAEPQPGETRTDNNELPFSVEVHERKLRVLYVDGYPRWEYRYLFPLLRREKSLEDSVLLLSSGSDFPQEGKKPIRVFPATLDELHRDYDVVLFGDFDPEEGGPLRGIEHKQLEMIVEWVQTKGGGFGFVAGERFGLAKWAGTPIGKLINVEPAAGGHEAPEGDLTASFPLRLTEQGRGHPIFVPPGQAAGAAAPEGADARTGWEKLPGLFWHYPARRAKPATEVLAEHPTAKTEGGAPVPLVVAGQFGRGPTLFVGTDDTWRWRYYDGEPYFNAFWLQALRYLGRERQKSASSAVEIRIDRPKARTGETVTMTAVVSDAALARRFAEAGRVELVVTTPDGRPVGVVDLPAEAGPRRDGAPAVFRGEHRPDRPGTYLVRLRPGVEVSLDETVRALQLQVEPARQEELRLEADPAALAELQTTAAEEVFARFGPADTGPTSDRLKREAFRGGDEDWAVLRRLPGVRHRSAGNIPAAERDLLLKRDLSEPLTLAELGDLPALIPARTAPPAKPASESIWDSKAALAVFLLLLTAEWVVRKRLKMV